MKVLDIELPRSYRRQVSGDYPVVGVDTESLTSGYAFVVCDSGGRSNWIRSFDDVLSFFNHDEYAHCLLVAYNLNFDTSVMLKWLGKDVCTELINDGHVSVPGCVIQYIPSKYLQFRFGNRFVRVFDIAQFFTGSLNYNAQQYLGASKIDVGSKEFTSQDYGRRDILEYCTYDAILTKGLGDYVVNAYDKIGVRVSSLASPASVIESYMLDQVLLRNDVRGVPVDALEYAVHSFDGAWFENFKAGTFPTTYRYDLVSAYPSVIRNLIDLSLGYWVDSKRRPKGAWYGYAYADVDVPKGYISPFVFTNAVGEGLHPHGKWTRYWPIPVLDWGSQHGVRIKVHSARWFVPFEVRYKFRGVIDKFFAVKRDNKSTTMEAWSAKLALAGVYGKFLQHRNNRGGRLYNPIYASEITSTVSLQMADAALSNPEAAIAVMSDCVISQGPLNLPVGREIGQWSRKGPDASLWIGPAQYETEGIDQRFRKIPWKNLLERNPNAGEYAVTRKGPLTLLQGIRLNRFEDVGIFLDRTVTFDIRKLNWRRFWPSRPKCGGDLLTDQYDSRQLHVSSRLRAEDIALWEL